jgi:hypothetical protein
MLKIRVPLTARTQHAWTTAISIDKLVRLVGTPHCPALVDVRTDAAIAIGVGTRGF